MIRKTKPFFSIAASALFLLTACSMNSEADYPIDNDDARRLRNGRITGDGWVLFGNDDKNTGGEVSGLAVNSYLWRAALDTVSFMPLASTDPFGGVIITDWYENPETPGERFKLNIVIMDKSLRADGVKVSIFRQEQDARGNWRDAEPKREVAKKFEDIILTRARELRVKAES